MIRPPPSSTLFPYTALFRSLAVTDPAQMPVREARPREPKTATVERREASVPRHGKCSLHSTLYDSTAVWIIPRNIVLLQQDRKSTRLNSSHSQISYAVFCLI